MKITKQYLTQVIKEELEQVLQEQEKQYNPEEIASMIIDEFDYNTTKLGDFKWYFNDIAKRILNRRPEMSLEKFLNTLKRERVARPEDKRFMGYYEGWQAADYQKVATLIDDRLKDIDYEDRLSGYDTIDE